MLASQRASRARKRRYENVRLKVSLAIHTCVHSGKENITEKPCRVTSIYIFSFFLFNPPPTPPPPTPANFKKTTTLTAVFLMNFFVFFCFLQLDYIVFLALFSYVILVRQATTPSNVETVVILFVCSLFTEEIRQVRQVHRGEVILG